MAQPVQSMTREIWRLKGEDEDPKRIQDFTFCFNFEEIHHPGFLVGKVPKEQLSALCEL